YGLSLTSYIIQQRVQQAEYLLIHTNLTIQKIAETVGYTNFSYFTKMFKKVTNMPPMQYRQEHQELK
ncbi:MAG: helix-turn-helix transcriptional regulator, partial [Schleiferilactobacillus harbinensis]